LGNDAFQKRVGKLRGGLQILRGFGFMEDAGQGKLVLNKVDEKLINEGVKLLKNFM
jgi:hypothetical protein